MNYDSPAFMRTGTYCGDCYRRCSAGETCTNRQCTCPADPSHAVCNGVCTDISADEASCGACGQACGPAQQCQDGTCRTVCQYNQLFCNDQCQEQGSLSACGACGMTVSAFRAPPAPLPRRAATRGCAGHTATANLSVSTAMNCTAGSAAMPVVPGRSASRAGVSARTRRPRPAGRIASPIFQVTSSTAATANTCAARTSAAGPAAARAARGEVRSVPGRMMHARCYSRTATTAGYAAIAARGIRSCVMPASAFHSRSALQKRNPIFL